MSEEATDSFKVGDRTFTSRLIIGSGKYASFEQNRACADASGDDALASALRRLRRREMVRIAWRDIGGLADLEETLRLTSI